MKFLRPAILGFSIALALAGCGGGGSDSIALVPVSSSAQPQLGAFSAGASVAYFRPDGSSLGSGLTDASGKAIIDLGTYTGPFSVVINGASGVTYYDEADGQNKPFGVGASMMAIVKGSAGGLNTVGVTPLTNAAARLAGLSPSAPGVGSRTATEIDTANSQVALMFGLPSGFDITKPPTSISAGSTSLTGTSDASVYAAVLSALAISAKNSGLDPATSAAQIATAFSATTPGQTNATLAALLTDVQSLLAGNAVGGVTLASRLTLASDISGKLNTISTSVVTSGRVPLPN
ncbi:MAG: hypothetical protein ACOYLX_17965, partial [Burkholderiaceae bacterium]